MVSPNASTGASPKPSAGNRNVASPIAALPRMPIAMPSSIASSTTTISPASNASATWHLAKHSTIPRDRTPARGPIRRVLELWPYLRDTDCSVAMGPRLRGDDTEYEAYSTSLHRLVGAVDDVLGRGENRSHDLLQLGARRWIDFGLGPLGLAQEIGIDHELVKGCTQRCQAIGRNVRRRDQCAADGGGGRIELHDRLCGRIVHDILHQRNVGNFVVAAQAGLDHRHEHAVPDLALVHAAPLIPGARHHVDLATIERNHVF